MTPSAPVQPIIALDAMGGDRAPLMVVKGALRTASLLPNSRFLFFGREKRLAPLLERLPSLAERSEVRHTEREISADTLPAQALRKGKGTSMWSAIEAVREGEAGCIVSAGNTGALMALSKFLLRTIPGISRPAICCYFPNRHSETVMLDVGANVDSSADMLVRFALMGDAFARAGLGLRQPRVGLLNIGAEAIKGRAEIKEAARIFEQNPELIRYFGFVEGNEIFSGDVDVVVADGFSGNIALKTIEGTANFFLLLMNRVFRASLVTRLSYSLLRSTLRRFLRRTDPRYYNGAVFLGLNGIVIKSHGGTDEIGFSNAISIGANIVSGKFLERMNESLETMKMVLSSPPPPNSASLQRDADALTGQV